MPTHIVLEFLDITGTDPHSLLTGEGNRFSAQAVYTESDFSFASLGFCVFRTNENSAFLIAGIDLVAAQHYLAALAIRRHAALRAADRLGSHSWARLWRPRRVGSRIEAGHIKEDINMLLSELVKGKLPIAGTPSEQTLIVGGR